MGVNGAHAPPTPQRKRVWFVRHGEAEHNATRDSSVRDPGLTPKGCEQARALARTKALEVGAQLIVVSPLRRTLQTAELALPDVSAPRVATPLIQEIGTSNADTGRPAEELRAEFGVEFDLSEVEDMWYVKPAPWCKQRRIPLDGGLRALADRQCAFVAWLQRRAETSMVVVTHHGFICHLLAVELRNCEVAAMELTPDGEWLDQPGGANPPRIPIVHPDGHLQRHKGSRPLRACRETIEKQHGAAVLAASERALAGEGRGGAADPGQRRVLFALRSAVAAALVSATIWHLLRAK